MATLFGQAVRWPLVGRTKTLAASSHRLRGPQDISCLWRAVATVRAVSASEMGFESCGSSSTRSSMAQPFLAKLVSHVDRSRNVATPFFSKCYPLLILLGNPTAELFTSTRTPLALRNTYYLRSRSGASTRDNGRLGGNWGGNSGGRGDGPNAWRRFKAAINALPQSALVWGIIGTNAIVFLAWQYAEQSYRQFRDPKLLTWMFQNFTTSWDNLRQGRVWTLVTSCFSHSTSGHILMNLLTFYFFAPFGASILGNVPFLALYLGGGIASSGISLLWNRVWPKPGPPRPSHGASGGINAVLAFFACAFPKATVYLFFVRQFASWSSYLQNAKAVPAYVYVCRIVSIILRQYYKIVPLPAWAAIGGLIGWDFYSAIVQRQGSVVDSAGHLGGALGGALFFLRWRMGRTLF